MVRFPATFPAFQALALLSASATSVSALDGSFDSREATIDSVHNALFTGLASCRTVVSSFIARIEAYNPTVNAIIALNPQALNIADEIDAQIASGNSTGALLCIPVLLKDNYDAAGMNTTGASRALVNNRPLVDAPTVKALKDAGAIILGKTNLHEMALEGISVSSLGGQTINPYDLTRTPGGSSGGSGAAIGASFAILATGTDTVNSLRSPASANALFSFRPTRGLISRAGVIPISHTQDTLGAMARTLKDLTVALTVMSSVGYDPKDNDTAAIPPSARGRDYSSDLYSGPRSLRGLRFGLLDGFWNHSASLETTPVNNVMQAMLTELRAAGAVLVNITDPRYNAPAIAGALDVQRYEYRELVDAYLAATPGSPRPQTLKELYAPGDKDFVVLPSGYEYVTTSLVSSTGNSSYFARQRGIQTLKQALEATFAANDLDAVIYPEQKNLVVKIGAASQAGRNGILAALTGVPVVVVPAGFSEPSEEAPVGVPVGMEILGRPWSEGALLGIARRVAELVPARRMPPWVDRFVEGKRYESVPVVKPDTTRIPGAYPLGVL
ncbi:amidase signature domain-containing protein [Schizothecium vesticola]|uniref:Amidase signature domain-containing protein n=1 Tax=Schizothecium vesticola TaxID=314040 RepID=A0AA40F1V0_9PEZI|nr:amidase signature domain-containing protein [Schizothecium vesticola]